MLPVAVRPAIGFVVEGDGEYAAYPSLAARSVGKPINFFPRVNARGFGNILRNVEEHLDDLTRTHHPLHIVVALDLREVLRRRLSADCATLRQDLTTTVNQWLVDRKGAAPLEPLPDAVTVVIQRQTFETWWLSDHAGLRRSGFFRIDSKDCQWSDVDSEIENPTAWLQQRMIRPTNLKSRTIVKNVVKHLDPIAMAGNSRSFRKLVKEISSAYTAWETAVTGKRC